MVESQQVEQRRGEPVAQRDLRTRGASGLAEELLGAISAIRRAGRREAAKPAELSSLTDAQLELVRLVRRRPGISIAEAAAELRLAANTVSTLVRSLTDQSVMVRYVDRSDRRVARLDLTATVRRKVHAWRDRRVDAVAMALCGLPEEDRVDMVRIVEVLAAWPCSSSGNERASPRCGRSGGAVPRPSTCIRRSRGARRGRPPDRARRGVRPARPERRRQDDDDPVAQHTPAAPGRGDRGVRLRRAHGLRWRCVAASATCRSSSRSRRR